MKKWVEAFVERVNREKLPVEAILAYQGNALMASHRWTADVPRNIYSHTKSFMATAVGLAVSDGVLSLEDRPADFFPESLPQDGADALAGLTLRHLLSMSSGFGRALLMSDTRARVRETEKDFARYVLQHPPKQAPGTAFCYSNGDSYLAGRMVEARVGMSLQAYLDARLFRPMEIPCPEWEQDPLGQSFGASGMLLRTEDMAKLGRLYLMGGRWAGRQLVDPAWIREATRQHIEVPREEGNPWNFAYGYQFWLSPYPDAYRADGAYGQVTTVLPQADAVIAIQCAESERFDGVRAALHEEVLLPL